MFLEGEFRRVPAPSFVPHKRHVNEFHLDDFYLTAGSVAGDFVCRDPVKMLSAGLSKAGERKKEVEVLEQQLHLTWLSLTPAVLT